MRGNEAEPKINVLHAVQKGLLELNPCQVKAHIQTAMKSRLLSNALPLARAGESMVRTPGARPGEAPMLKMDMQDYNINESGYPSLKNHIRVPQKTKVSYDCILNTKKAWKPPDIPLEIYNPYYSNYYSLAALPHAFNKKLSPFSYYTEKTQKVVDSLHAEESELQKTLRKPSDSTCDRCETRSIHHHGKLLQSVDREGSRATESRRSGNLPLIHDSSSYSVLPLLRTPRRKGLSSSCTYFSSMTPTDSQNIADYVPRYEDGDREV